MEVIQRYLFPKKFKDLLEDGGVFMSPAQSQDDDQEGIYDLKLAADELHEYSQKYMSSMIDTSDPDLMKTIEEISARMMNHNNTTHFLSCWFIGKEESESMWASYGDQGVMVLSRTIDVECGFSSSISNSRECKRVVYDDAKKQQDFKDPYKYKNRLHSDGTDQTHQNEFRLVFDVTKYAVLTGFEKETRSIPFVGDQPSYMAESIISCIAEEDRLNGEKYVRKKGSGYILLCDLNKLIHEVRVYPGATDKYLSEVRELCKKHGLRCPVNRSSLKSSTE